MKTYLTIAFCACFGLLLTSCKKKEDNQAVTAGKPEEVVEAQRDLKERAQEAREEAAEARQEARDEQKDVVEERKDVAAANAEADAKLREARALDNTAYAVIGVEECDKYIERYRRCDKLSAADRSAFEATMANQRQTVSVNTDAARDKAKEACESADDGWDRLLDGHGC